MTHKGRQPSLPGLQAPRKARGKRQEEQQDLELLAADEGLGSRLEAMLLQQLRDRGLPEPLTQYRWHSTRLWRFDFAWPDRRIAVEVQGGVFSGGAHTRGAGFTADRARMRNAALHGWRVLEYTGEEVRRGTAIRELQLVLQPSGDP